MTQKHNDYQPIRYTLIVRPGMRVQISNQAVNAHNSRILPDHTGRVGFNDRNVIHGPHLYEIVGRIGASCELRDCASGQGGVWFNVHDLIFIQTYKGFTLKGKINRRTYAPEVPQERPWVAEIYYPDGKLMNWISCPDGLYASMRLAAAGISECLEEASIHYGIACRGYDEY